MNLKNLSSVQKKIFGQDVFLRLDLNVPMLGKKIKDDFKIKQSLESIKFLLNNDCRLIIASHLGQPEGAYKAQFSLAPVAKQLETLLDGPVKFLPFTKYSKFSDIRQELKKDKKNRIFVLDNVRFFSGEERNCKRLGKSFASLAQVYVNDAFAVSHRAHSSVSAIKNFLPSYAGLLLQKEIDNLNKIIKPEKPLVAIIGGAKISTKVPLINKIYPATAQVLVAGALANNFFKAQGFNIGQSLFSEKESELAKKYLKMNKIILPIDVVVKSELKNKKSSVSVKKLSEVTDNDNILDIGPKTIALFSKYISQAKTIVWNGPLGMFEEKDFAKGSLAIAKKVAQQSSAKKAFSVVGGGETNELLHLSGVSKKINWVSTGGGAMLSYLAGEDLPALQ